MILKNQLFSWLFWHFWRILIESNVVGKQVDSQLGSITMGAIDLALSPRLNNPIIKQYTQYIVWYAKNMYIFLGGTHTKNPGDQKIITDKQSR